MGKKILVIEDDISTLRLTKHNLEKGGYTVITAGSGMEGLRLARREMPDMLIVDVMMPKIDGFTVCRMLRYDEKFKHIPIIFVTGKVTEKDKAIAKEVGGDFYLTKPYKPEVLLEKVEELLEGVI
jgi:two-component system alkaline phosphatase synthesis response regulator PhoP